MLGLAKELKDTADVTTLLARVFALVVCHPNHVYVKRETKWTITHVKIPYFFKEKQHINFRINCS